MAICLLLSGKPTLICNWLNKFCSKRPVPRLARDNPNLGREEQIEGSKPCSNYVMDLRCEAEEGEGRGRWLDRGMDCEFLPFYMFYYTMVGNTVQRVVKQMGNENERV
jgi:hypothetical protein